MIDIPLRTVLYVEDNPVNLELMRQILELRPNLRLLAAMDGDQGIELARRHHPDVIMMDINLPGISGFEAMRILLTDPTTASIPIIAISANAIPGSFTKCHMGRFLDYISKPIRINVFLESLDAALEFSDAPAAIAVK